MCYVVTGCLTQPNNGPALVTESILVLALLFLLRVQLVFICMLALFYISAENWTVCMFLNDVWINIVSD